MYGARGASHGDAEPGISVLLGGPCLNSNKIVIDDCVVDKGGPCQLLPRVRDVPVDSTTPAEQRVVPAEVPGTPKVRLGDVLQELWE